MHSSYKKIFSLENISQRVFLNFRMIYDILYILRKQIHFLRFGHVGLRISCDDYSVSLYIHHTCNILIRKVYSNWKPSEIARFHRNNKRFYVWAESAYPKRNWKTRLEHALIKRNLNYVTINIFKMFIDKHKRQFIEWNAINLYSFSPHIFISVFNHKSPVELTNEWLKILCLFAWQTTREQNTN